MPSTKWQWWSLEMRDGEMVEWRILRNPEDTKNILRNPDNDWRIIIAHTNYMIAVSDGQRRLLILRRVA